MLSIFEIFSAAQKKEIIIKFERFVNRLGIELPNEYLNLIYFNKLNTIKGQLKGFPEDLSVSNFNNLLSIREIYYTYNHYIPYKYKHNTLPIAQDENRNLICFQRIHSGTILSYFEDSTNKFYNMNMTFKEFIDKL